MRLFDKEEVDELMIKLNEAELDPDSRDQMLEEVYDSMES